MSRDLSNDSLNYSLREKTVVTSWFDLSLLNRKIVGSMIEGSLWSRNSCVKLILKITTSFTVKENVMRTLTENFEV